MALKIVKSRFKIFQSLPKKPKSLPIILTFAKVAKFRQIWSHWWWFVLALHSHYSSIIGTNQPQGNAVKRTQSKSIRIHWAAVLAQLAEWSLPVPEVRGLNPSIGKIL